MRSIGKKYIIELINDCPSEFKGIIVFGLTPNGQISAEPIPVEDLPPYTEPDLEQVRKEAYEKGYEDGFVAGHLKAEKSGQSFYEDGYKRGLSEAWEAARKIAKLDTDEQKRLFGCFGIYSVAHKFSAVEAIEKLKTYEQEQEEIKVGDEVERILDGEVDSKAVFLEENNGYYHCLFWTGRFFTTLSYPKKQFRKTGRHFPEIAAVIEKMRGEKE